MTFEKAPVPKTKENNEGSDNRVEINGFGTELDPLTIKKLEDMTPKERKAWEANRKAYSGQLDKLEEWKSSGWLIKESKSKPGEFKRKPWSHMEERLNHNLLPKASSLTMPVLLYVGSEDISIPPEHVQILFEAIPDENKDMVILEGAGHVYRTEDEISHLYNTVSDWIAKLS